MNTRLYKAERLNGGGVVKGYYCKVGETITGEASPEGIKHFIIPVGTTSLEGAVEIDVKTLAQYTGVKDKNGKEICQYNECRLVKKDALHTTARGYIGFVDGSYVFIEYIYRTGVLLSELEHKGFEIEVVTDWYDKILLKEKCDDKDDGKSESEEKPQTDNTNCEPDTSDNDKYIKFLEYERDDVLESLEINTDIALRTTVGAYPCAEEIKEKTEYSIKNAFARCIEEFKNMKNL